MAEEAENPADAAGRIALARMFACLDEGRSFRLEAGAGAGKTYSLDKALRRLIDRRGPELLRRGQQVGCITYTNVAKDEIISRIQAHPAVRPETIHSFCWSILQDFQSTLRALVATLEGWAERLEPIGGIGARRVHYELGYPMRLPEPVEEAERRLADAGPEPTEGESRRITQLRKLRVVPYTELIALDRFIDGHTPFATKHGVKGAEFENVLVIVGRGWNKYNFGQMLEWIEAGPPVGRTEFFENNRNLFYVACSRPKIRLALLFTQVLSANAMAQLRAWFGADNIVALPAEPVAVPA